MVMETIGRLVKDFEKKTGAPPLSKLADTLSNFPDAKQLHLIKDTLQIAERIANKVPDLNIAVELIKGMGSVSPEQLQEWEKFLKRVEAILKKTPQEVIDFLMKLKEE